MHLQLSTAVAQQAAQAQAFFGIKQKGRFSVQDDHEDDPCSIPEEVGKRLLEHPDCAAVKAAFGGDPETATQEQILAGYNVMCGLPNCYGRFVGILNKAQASPECVAAGGQPSLSEFVCQRRDNEVSCLDWMFGALYNEGSYTSFCNAEYNTTFNAGLGSGDTEYSCCAVAEGGCCLTEIMLMNPEADMQDIQSGFTAMCGAEVFSVDNECEAVDTDACHVTRALKFSEFSGDGRESTLQKAIATELEIDPYRITIDSVISPVGGDTTVQVSIKSPCESADDLKAKWNGETLSPSTYDSFTLNADATGASENVVSNKLVDSGNFADNGCQDLSTLSPPACASACVLTDPASCQAASALKDCFDNLADDCAVPTGITREIGCHKDFCTESSAPIVAASSLLALFALF